MNSLGIKNKEFVTTNGKIKKIVEYKLKQQSGKLNLLIDNNKKSIKKIVFGKNFKVDVNNQSDKFFNKTSFPYFNNTSLDTNSLGFSNRSRNLNQNTQQFNGSLEKSTSEIIFLPIKQKTLYQNTQESSKKIRINYCTGLSKDETYLNSYEDNKIENTNMENEIKKLNILDNKHLIEKDLQVQNKQILNIKEVESINWVGDMKIKLKNLNFSKTNPNIENFLRVIEMNEKSICLQNINISKYKFNFDIFNKEKEKPTSSKGEKIITSGITDQNNIITSQEKMLEKLSSKDFYRDVIKEKMKFENECRKEIMRTSKIFYEKKIEKKKLEKIRDELLNQLFKIRKEHSEKKDQLEIQNLNLQIKGNDFLRNNPRSQNLDRNLQYSPNRINVLRKDNSSLNVNRIIALDPAQFKIQSVIVKQIYAFGEVISKLNKNFDMHKENMEKEILKFNSTILDVDREIKILKNNISDLTQDQSNYFYEALRNGVDVRFEGISWIVKRLIELNAIVDPSKFPRYLDTHQIDYILKSAFKSVENDQLKIILHTLKNRQRKIRDENTESMMKSTKNFFSQTNFDFVFFNTDNNNTKRGNIKNNVFSPKTIEQFRAIFIKYEEITKYIHEKRIEEILIKQIVDGLRNNLKFNTSGKKGKDDRFYDENKRKGTLNSHEQDFLNYIQENNKQKQYFEEVMMLRETIKKNEEDFEKMRKDEIVFFKAKYDHANSTKNSIDYDISYSTLFGNGITL